MRFKLMAIAAMSLLLSFYASAQVTWIGAGDGVSWADAANWSSGAMPLPGDDVVLDNSAVTGNYDVSLPANGTIVTVNSLTITPGASSVIRLLIPASNSANPALHILTTGDAFTLNTGASMINSSGSNIIIEGNFTLNGTSSVDLSAGTGSSNIMINGNIVVSAANAITESGTGNPVIDLNGNIDQTISSVAGAITGDNLDFVVNTTGTVTLLSNVFLPHDLFVQAGTIDVSNSSAANVLGVKGDLTVQGTITESGTGLPRITLNGTANQNIIISGAGNITGDNLEFRLSNSAGATLLSDLVLPYWFTIASGNLFLGNFSLTVIYVQLIPPAVVATNHIVTNGTGFLIIPNVVANATFPIGADATSVNEVSITNGEGLTYSVRVEAGIHPDISMPLYAIDRTWTILASGVPVNPVVVNFSYYPGQGTTYFDYSATDDIGQYTPTAWSIIKNNILPAHDGDASIVAAFISSFNTPFVIGNHGAILPLDYRIVCKAQKKEEAAVIAWNVENEPTVSRFEIERSVAGSLFKSIATVYAVDQKLSYEYNDPDVANGSNLYRVKVIFSNGKVRYSNTVALVFRSNAILLTSVATNPTHNSSMLTISSPFNRTMKLFLYDAQGKIVRQWEQKIVDGNNTMVLPVSDLLNGVYFLSGTDGIIRTNVLRILKQ